MKRVIDVSFGVHESQVDDCLGELAPLRPRKRFGPINKRWIFHFTVDRPDIPRVEVVARRYSEHYRVSPDDPFSYREECVFTRKELDTAEMLEVWVNRSPLAYIGMVEGGTVYDWTIKPTDDNPAPWCWQKTPWQMKKKDIPKPHVGLHFSTMAYIIHRRLLDLVQGLSYEHVKLGPIIASGQPSDWFQLMADRVMPPYHEATTGIQTYGMEYAPSGSPRTIVSKAEEGEWPAYRRADVLERFGRIPPVTFTWELGGWWGVGIGRAPWPPPGDLSHQNAPPQPALVVDQQTRRDLIAAGVKRLKYVPVRWMD